jgi:hypothetical protein
MSSRRVLVSSSSIAGRSGSQRSRFSGHSRAAGATPTMVATVPAIRSGLPTIARSAPNRRVQSASEITTTFGDLAS